jgi:hypothetical protein
MSVKTKNNGCIRYYNDNHVPHREDGPAIEYPNGYKLYCINGKIHREDGPASIYPDGSKNYYLSGKNYTDITSDEEWIKLVLKIKLLG